MRAVCIVVMAAATLVSAAATPPPPVCPPTGDAATTATTEPVYEWTSIAFDFPGGQPSGDSYQPPLCVPSGVKVYQGTYYLTFARWHTTGIPVTLAKVPVAVGGGDKSPVLHAFPDWPSQTVGDPTAFQSVQDVEIDSEGRMWILDVGRAGLLDATPPVSPGPPKLVVYDLNSGKVVARHVFSADVMDYDTSFANDLVIDQPRQVAYISDASGVGGVVVVDMSTGKDRRFQDASFGISNQDIVVDGNALPLRTPVDGIALSPDREYFYYCSLDSTKLYRVATSVLRNFASPAMVPSLGSAAELIGDKGDATGGMVFSAAGVLYFGGMQCNQVVAWDASKPLVDREVLLAQAPAGVARDSRRAVVAPSDATPPGALSWIDTFAFDGTAVVFTVNRLQQLLFPQEAGAFDMSPGAPANFRIFRIDVGSASYLSAQPASPSGDDDSASGSGEDDDADALRSMTLVAVGVSTLACMLAVALLVTSQQLCVGWKRRSDLRNERRYRNMDRLSAL